MPRAPQAVRQGEIEQGGRGRRLRIRHLEHIVNKWRIEKCRKTMFNPNITGYITGHMNGACNMDDTPQNRAIRNYRARLGERGMARFEVLGLESDRALIRALARRLAGDGPDAAGLRAAVRRIVADDAPKKGGILAALRRSPLVGADLDVARPRDEGRKIDL